MLSTISFILDGKIRSINFDQDRRYTPTTTLLNFLRSLPYHKGTKEGCAEGDCGACTVVIAEETKNNKIVYRAIDSCLVFLPMIHGKQLITVENLKTDDGQLHPVQQAVVETNGSQCGFCTPGIVMSLFALYKNYTNPSRADIEESLSGNLCRCTGYVPLVEAAKIACTQKKKDHFAVKEKTIARLLKKIPQKSIHIKLKQQNYFSPSTLKEALQLRYKYPQADLINGATDIALRVTKKYERLSSVIDLSSIIVLRGIAEKKKYCLIGSGVRLSELKKYTKKKFPAFFDLLSVFGSVQIRNLATIGGNLGTASPIGDIAPLLIAYQAEIILRSKKNKRVIAIDDFIKGYRKTACRKDELIVAIKLPYPSKNTQIRFYKFSKRKDVDISTVSGGFRLELDSDETVKKIILAFGGMAETISRAKKTEKFFNGKTWDRQTIEKACSILESEFEPITDARASAQGRSIAAKNLLIKFWFDTTHSNRKPD